MLYENRYVGFVDILGFQHLVERTVSEPSGLASLYDTLLQIADYKPSLGGGLEDFRVTTFSDCVAISARVTDVGLWSVVLAIHALQFNLSQTGVLFRGAVAKGDVIHDQKVLFGPAFNEAYRLETKVSLHPRVMLADNVYDDALASEKREFPNYVGKYLLKLAFDVPCIDPFGDFKAVVAMNGNLAAEKLTQIKTNIETKLRECAGSPELVAKWTWLARRYNDLIAGLGISQPPAIDTIIY